MAFPYLSIRVTVYFSLSSTTFVVASDVFTLLNRIICLISQCSISNVRFLDPFRSSGDKGIRTLDPLLARQVLSQLSYTPILAGDHLCSHIVTNVVFSAGQILTVVFGMGTGVTPDRIITNQWDKVDSNHRPHAYQACALTG